jgi:hypothetical protein
MLLAQNLLKALLHTLRPNQNARLHPLLNKVRYIRHALLLSRLHSLHHALQRLKVAYRLERILGRLSREGTGVKKLVEVVPEIAEGEPFLGDIGKVRVEVVVFVEVDGFAGRRVDGGEGDYKCDGARG